MAKSAIADTVQKAQVTPWWLIVLRYFEKRQLGVEMTPGKAGMRIMVYKVVRITSIEVLKRRYPAIFRDRVVIYHIDEFKGHVLKQHRGKVYFTEKGEEILKEAGYNPDELLRIWRHGVRTVAAEKKNRKRR
jgi:hypothetical protein